MIFRRSHFVPAALAVTLLMAGPATAPAPAQEPTAGIDVSRFQAKVRWHRVASDGVDFAYVQASRGSGADCAVVPQRCGVDEFYERNRRRARVQGIVVGSYHRAFAGGSGRKGVKRDARAEARLFLAQVTELESGELLPALDVETPFGGLDARELRIWIKTWLRRVERRLGAKPIIYTNASSWRATGGTRKFARAGHRLWVANFGVSSPAVPAAGWNGEGWAIWQYTSSGRVRGIRGRVDLNRLAVPLEELTVP